MVAERLEGGACGCSVPQGAATAHRVHSAELEGGSSAAVAGGAWPSKRAAQPRRLPQPAPKGVFFLSSNLAPLPVAAKKHRLAPRLRCKPPVQVCGCAAHHHIHLLPHQLGVPLQACKGEGRGTVCVRGRGALPLRECWPHPSCPLPQAACLLCWGVPKEDPENPSVGRCGDGNRRSVRGPRITRNHPPPLRTSSISLAAGPSGRSEVMGCRTQRMRTRTPLPPSPPAARQLSSSVVTLASAAATYVSVADCASAEPHAGVGEPGGSVTQRSSVPASGGTSGVREPGLAGDVGVCGCAAAAAARGTGLAPATAASAAAPGAAGSRAMLISVRYWKSVPLFMTGMPVPWRVGGPVVVVGWGGVGGGWGVGGGGGGQRRRPA